ncbi:MAG: radical SAM protein [Ignavibacteriota bacterium]|nr:MAG: radical SAM protein [Chlorobiota bacterium]MBE7477693.1 SPASM domain-containing protein [Ignavibacteriales bacterium]MBL1123802.1 radical SAM protein [Ignavibacteriota bacterium]MCC7092828.1 SPASM domain-containing protein [Ignavibacteriaceae bacterium]MCE7855961.1 radical SAM protein [Ignavibacteria bacterium CHB3]
MWGMPISYSIEPTNHCNLKCPECPSGLGALTRPLGLLKSEDFKKLVDEISKTGFYIQLFFQGEPYINKNLPEMISYAQSKKVYVSISTNGHFVNAKNVDQVLDNAPDKLIFSVDGLDEESYQKYRIGGTFEQADSGLRALINRKIERGFKKPFVEFQFIVMKQNEHQLGEVKKYCKEVGVDKLVFKTMQISSYENALKFLPTNKKFRRYALDDQSFRIKNEIKNHCFALWRTSVITWDGRVVPCCFDKDAENEIGLVNGKSFSEIWRSAKYYNFRKKILDDRKSESMCTNCTEGLKVNIFEIEQ